MRLDLGFMLLAAATLLLGSCMGMWMGMVHDFTLAPVHAHLNLVGWASLALFGLAYRAWPAMADSRLAVAHITASGTGALALPAGIALAVLDVTPLLAILGALLWVAGAALFLLGLLRLAFAPEGRLAPVPAE